MNKIKSLKPLADRVLVRKIVPKTKTESGILLTSKATERDARFGQIVSSGPGRADDNGQIVATSVKAGDFVLLPEYSGTPVHLDQKDAEFMLYRESELLGVLEGAVEEKI